jgi:hypothetical protein
MAYIRVRDTKARAKGRPVRSYAVSWREPVRDEYGAIVPGKTIQRTETFKGERQAKARLREIESHLASFKGGDPSRSRVKANTPLGTYARQYLDSLAGTVDDSTIEGSRRSIAPTSGLYSVISQWLPSPPRTSQPFGQLCWHRTRGEQPWAPSLRP